MGSMAYQKSFDLQMYLCKSLNVGLTSSFASACMQACGCLLQTQNVPHHLTVTGHPINFTMLKCAWVPRARALHSQEHDDRHNQFWLIDERAPAY